MDPVQQHNASASTSHITQSVPHDANSTRIQQATQLASQFESAFFRRIGKVTIHDGTFIQHNHIIISSRTPNPDNDAHPKGCCCTVNRNEKSVTEHVVRAAETLSAGPPPLTSMNGTTSAPTPAHDRRKGMMSATVIKCRTRPPPLPPKPAELRKEHEMGPNRYEVEEPPPPRIKHARSVPLMASRRNWIDAVAQTTHRSMTSESDSPILQRSLVPTAPLPVLAQLQIATSVIRLSAQDPISKVAWCRDVFYLVDRSIQAVSKTDSPIGPVTIPDASLAQLADIAVSIILQLTSSLPSLPQGLPYHLAEAIAMRGTLAATGAFPRHVTYNPRTAFRDFEIAAKNGFPKAFFKVGRDLEKFNDYARAKKYFERGVKQNVESCIWRMGMAHLLGQLDLPSNPTLGIYLLYRAATLASPTCPQPAYVFALLLVSELPDVPPFHRSLFSPYIPKNSSHELEAKKYLEKAAFLHFAPAQYRLGYVYEFAEAPFPFDPLLSLQYYALASQQGEVEADMALSRWFLCGSHGTAGRPDGFEKDEALALSFARKAANKNMPLAQFAMGYYAEVGIGQPTSLESAIHWYTLAAQLGNGDASDRLKALCGSGRGVESLITREEHENVTGVKFGKRRSMAMERMKTPLPVWEEGKERYRQVVENIRKNSLPDRESNRDYSDTVPSVKVLSESTKMTEPVPRLVITRDFRQAKDSSVATKMLMKPATYRSKGRTFAEMGFQSAAC